MKQTIVYGILVLLLIALLQTYEYREELEHSCAMYGQKADYESGDCK